MKSTSYQPNVVDFVTALKNALQADYVVLGGGNAKQLKRLPKDVRLAITTMHLAVDFGCGKKLGTTNGPPA